MKKLVDIEEDWLEEAKEVGDHESYKDAVNVALQEYVQKRRMAQYARDVREGRIMKDIADDDVMSGARR